MKITCLGLLLVSSIGTAQTPTFEVASIRPAVDARGAAREPFFCPFGCFNEGRLKIVGSRVDVSFMALDHLIVRAYRVQPHQLAGPEWMKQQRFDILANLPERASTDQVPEMLQGLLVERFKLRTHRDSREQPVYALVVDKGGPLLKESVIAVIPESSSDTTLNSSHGPLQARQTEQGMTVTKGPWGQMRFTLSAPGQKGPEIELLNITMLLLADVLTQFMDRPVIDMTALKGIYQIGLSGQDMGPFVAAKATALGMGRRPPRSDAGDLSASDPTGGSTIFKTMETLGLKLERTKLPVEMLVVDHLEKTPTDN